MSWSCSSPSNSSEWCVRTENPAAASRAQIRFTALTELFIQSYMIIPAELGAHNEGNCNENASKSIQKKTCNKQTGHIILQNSEIK